MFETIIVGVDGAAGGQEALRLARQLGGPEARIVATSVAVVDGHPSRGANRDYDQTAVTDAEYRLDRALVGIDDDVDTKVLIAGSVAAGLHEAAVREGADLIAIGCCRLGRIGRIMSGNDTRQTLRDAPCPVVVAPRRYALRDDGRIHTIGVGFDGRPDAGHALEVARAVARHTGAEIHALDVVGMPPWAAGESALSSKDVELAVARSEEEIAALDGVTGTTATGLAADELAEFSEQVDLLIVGSRGLGPIGRIALGSTSEMLADRAAAPLMVVPRATSRETVEA